jgi:hypothetical protein
VGALALALVLVAARADALVGASVRDLVDPVPPGGVLTYLVQLSNLGNTGVYCFNPPPECVSSTADCVFPAPNCVGDAFTGFVCRNAGNEGANCGVGDPPVPNANLCTPLNQGTCNGGSRVGLPCNVLADCPGSSLVCRRALNEGAYCGSGTPPVPNQSFCLPNPTGICSGGPAAGLPCTAPHGQTTDECPSNTAPVPVTVTLPVPPNTTLIEADNGGTSDGTTITWTMPPLSFCGTNPTCPLLTARLTVDPGAIVGTVLQVRATATDADGLRESLPQTTTIGFFGRTKAILSYPRPPTRDSFVYRTRFTLLPGQSLNPVAEEFRIQVLNSQGTLLDLALPPNTFQVTGAYHRIIGYAYKSGGTGLTRVFVEEKFPGHFWVRVLAQRMDLPDLLDPNIVVNVTIGDDTFGQALRLVPSRTNRKFTVNAN